MKVLLIRLSSLGDVVLATSAVEALREDLPGVEVHVLTRPAFREVFEGNPGVARVWEWARGEGVASVACRVRTERYDWVADLHGNLRTRLLRLATPGVRWTAYRKGSLRRRLAVVLRRPGLLDDSHVVDRYLAALGPLVSARRRLPRLHPSEAASQRAQRLLRAGGWDGQAPLLAVAPGARWATKAWPKRHWIELLRAVQEEGLGVPVLLGGREEEALCRSLLGESGALGINLAGETSIGETGAVLALSRVLVTNDSAPLHLAESVGTPVVALFGPTVRGFGFFPLGVRDVVLERALPCRPCSLHGDDVCPKRHHRCLAEVDASAVFDRLQDLLSAPQGGKAR